MISQHCDVLILRYTIVINENFSMSRFASEICMIFSANAHTHRGLVVKAVRPKLIIIRSKTLKRHYLETKSSAFTGSRRTASFTGFQIYAFAYTATPFSGGRTWPKCYLHAEHIMTAGHRCGRSQRAAGYYETLQKTCIVDIGGAGKVIPHAKESRT